MCLQNSNYDLFRRNQAKYKAYKAKSKAQKPPSAAEFANCVDEPLINLEDDELVINRIPPEELHLHLGSVNKHVKEINQKWGNNRFYKWCGFRNVPVEKYYSHELNGNSCKKVLEKLDDLESEIIKSEHPKVPELLTYVTSLRAYDKVRKSCFGMDLLESFEEDIAAYKVVYEKVGLNVTTKAHIIFEHVIPFCKKTSKGLGHFSEFLPALLV